jgi:hypothetical protein
MVTNKELNEEKEEGCFSITIERKYYQCDNNSFIKRSLRQKEWQTNTRGAIVVPHMPKERLMNEAACLKYIRGATNIPVPTVYAAFEDDEAYYLITEYIEGVSMANLSEEEKTIVQREVEVHLATMKGLKSRRIGGPSGIVCPPCRVSSKAKNTTWSSKASGREHYVFCHNDLSQYNIIVNPATLKVSGIIDWEYAGFYPGFFEGHFYKRKGPSCAIAGETDDTNELLEFLSSMNGLGSPEITEAHRRENILPGPS